MAETRGAGALLFVLFLDCWQCAHMHHPFPLVEGTVTGSNTDRSPSSKNLEEGIAKIFDEILLQVFSSVTFDASRRTAGKSTTNRAMEERSNTDRSPSSKNLEEGMAKIFDEILLQMFSNVPFHETRRTAVKSMTRRAMEEKNNPTNDQTHNPPHVENILQTLQRTVGHISEERRSKEPSLFDRAVSEQLTTVDQGGVEAGTQSRAVPCTQLLSFLQRNIVIAAASVAGILVATGLLLLMLTVHSRRKRPLYSPANITYNIFIMNGKTWWQKSQEKDSKKFAGKQKQLNCDSCV